MSSNLPHPNIQPPPGAQFPDVYLEEQFSKIQDNFDALALKFPVVAGDLPATVIKAIGAGNHRVSWGTASIAPSETLAIPHHLGVAPSSVQLTNGANTIGPLSLQALDATNISVKNQHTSFGAAILWLAIV